MVKNHENNGSLSDDQENPWKHLQYLTTWKQAQNRFTTSGTGSKQVHYIWNCATVINTILSMDISSVGVWMKVGPTPIVF